MGGKWKPEYEKNRVRRHGRVKINETKREYYQRNLTKERKRKARIARELYVTCRRIRNLEKRKANQVLRRAVEMGKVQKYPCEVCGDKAEGHHDDYSKPLEVRWLCTLHHRRLHHGLLKM